jgi:hypothetical protein
VLLGETLAHIDSVSGSDSRITFTSKSGRVWIMYHSQDCCESVEIEDIAGDFNDLVDSPILLAEVVTCDDDHPQYGSGMWTFYKLATVKGYVTIRWFGQENYYSVSVDFEEMKR